MVQMVRIVSDDIGMKFDLDKCAVLIMKTDTEVESGGIDLRDVSQLRALRDGSYKYLGLLEFDGVLYQEYKESVGGGSRSV